MKRFIKRALRQLRGRGRPTSVSDNDTYPQLCLRASRDNQVFANFRRNPAYNAILEHASEEQGRNYLEIINTDAELSNAMDLFKRNDDFGDPRTFEYPSVGHVSPTTLRYVKVLSDLKSYFETLDGFDICEIGVGYGGQCRIINAWFRTRSYCLVDMPSALALARRYLASYKISAALSYKSMNELVAKDYDLVISNYAYSELARVIQDVYLEKIILRSARGYITHNEISPAELNSYTADALLRIIPGAQKMKEKPLTHPKNCLIVWGHRDIADVRHGD